MFTDPKSRTDSENYFAIILYSNKAVGLKERVHEEHSQGTKSFELLYNSHSLYCGFNEKNYKVELLPPPPLSF